MSDLRKMLGKLKTSSKSSLKNTKAHDTDQNDVEKHFEDIDVMLNELDKLIGLSAVKSEVKKLVSLARVNTYRQKNKLNSIPITCHLVFSGNPGTGKTTVARLIGNIYRCLGIIDKGHIVECDRSALVAGYTGQTAIKTSEKVNEALGGVLFVDEAYSLTQKDSDSFGGEAIDTILKAMEDHRSDLIVIVAGYKDEMAVFLESNPGLRSRFKNFLHFDDFASNELLDIFKLFCKSNKIKLLKDAEVKLKRKIDSMLSAEMRHFGNARAMRNLFEDALSNQAIRATSDNVIEKHEVGEFTPDDIPN
jgi:SpoVK/Ycf46/Vps4 family AAA+-type ATPase